MDSRDCDTSFWGNRRQTRETEAPGSHSEALRRSPIEIGIYTNPNIARKRRVELSNFYNSFIADKHLRLLSVRKFKRICDGLQCGETAILHIPVDFFEEIEYDHLNNICDMWNAGKDFMEATLNGGFLISTINDSKVVGFRVRKILQRLK